MVFLFCAITPLVRAEDGPGVDLGPAANITGTVDAVDYTARTLRLAESEENSALALSVDKSAVNFERVKANDKVAVVYYDSVIVSLRRAVDPMVNPGRTIEVSLPGDDTEESRTVELHIKEVPLQVIVINYATRAMTLQNARGKTIAFTPGSEMMTFYRIRVGDEIIAQITEPLAISVEKI